MVRGERRWSYPRPSIGDICRLYIFVAKKENTQAKSCNDDIEFVVLRCWYSAWDLGLQYVATGAALKSKTGEETTTNLYR